MVKVPVWPTLLQNALKKVGVRNLQVLILLLVLFTFVSVTDQEVALILMVYANYMLWKRLKNKLPNKSFDRV